MRHSKHLKSVICLLLTMLMVFSVVLVAGAADKDIAQTGARTIYFRNTDNWSTVNAYVWVKNTTNSVKAWPGEAMTLHEGNIYKYTVSGDYNMIIFNNGGTQTGDLDLGQDGYLYDYSTKAWEKYAEPTPTDPTKETEESSKETEQEKPPVPSTTKLVYCKNSKGWSTVNAYMWSDGSGNNSSWPGIAMTNVGDDIWQYEVTGNWNKIIFNNGSEQTSDLTFPGTGYIYDLTTNKWEIYDTSPITVKSVATDLKAPQYVGSEIVLSADAVSTGGVVSYKFSVKNPSGATTVLRDFSSAKTALWNPTVAGDYTLIYDFKDAEGNTNQRTNTYKIADDSTLAEPVIKKVTPGSSQVKVNTNLNVTVTAGGGKTGTNLLFYKYTIKDATGKVVNVPYYTKNASYTYKPSALGKFTVTVSVQNCDNKTVERTYDYEAVNNVEESTESTNTTNTNPSGLLGDADNDSVLSVMDATEIQRYVAQLISKSDFRYDLSDYDKDGNVSVMDATEIQLKLAGL